MHGEKNVRSSVGSSSQVKEVPIGQYPMQDMLNDVFGGLGGQGFQESSSSSLPNSDHSTTIKDASHEELKKIRELMEDLKKRKVSGLKSHDSHILMEHLLPIAFRKSLPKEVASVLIELCNYFRELSCKVLDVKVIEKLQQRISLTLCHMEMIFPPSFFTIMVHLVIHLGEEAMLAGPVHYRWMYPVERSLGHLKSYVRNKAAPEGCIAEGYIVEECLTFCSRYLEDGDIETRFNRPRRNDDDNGVSSSSESTILLKLFPILGKPIGLTKIFSLPNMEMIQAHRYVLANCGLVDPFREKFKTEVTRMYRGKRNSTRVVEEYVHQHFHEWFKEYVARKDDFMDITSEIEWLARGPNNIARRFHGYNINGFKFRTEKKEQGLKTQNSGVVMSAITQKKRYYVKNIERHH
ncbi:hypothetical protein P8452_52570 [Trifolium repens]|nr:hypothetical protein P8452_52570 [Trifolium repens]